MADIATIRAALATKLTAAYANTCQISAYALANPSPPTLMVLGLSGTDYDSTFTRGGDILTMTLQGLAGTTADQAAQIVVDDWLDTTGSTSVKAAIESERPAATTLGGVVSYVRVTGTTGHRVYQMPSGTDLFGAEWTIEIHT